mgnify:CR=1 FL=1
MTQESLPEQSEEERQALIARRKGQIWRIVMLMMASFGVTIALLFLILWLIFK